MANIVTVRAVCNTTDVFWEGQPCCLVKSVYISITIHGVTSQKTVAALYIRHLHGIVQLIVAQLV
jgi:hypothetical protein